MSAQQPVPVMLLNPPVPALNPFLAILYQKFYERAVWLEFFVFSAIWNNPVLAANASGQQVTTTIDPSIDFAMMQMNLTAYSSPGVIVSSPDYLLGIQENSGRSVLSDQDIHVMNWTGQNRNSGSRSYDLPIPRYMRGNNTITAKLTNNTATAARVDLAYIGLRITYISTSRDQLFGVAF
jgi:hypothetical protein